MESQSASSSAESDTKNELLSVPDLCAVVQGELNNAGRALMCPICRSTYQDAVTLPCQHAYCRSCLRTALKQNKKCPTCQRPSNPRSLRDAPHLQTLALTFKKSLRYFGLAPVRYVRC